MVADFSERLRFFRSQRGLSQQELANAVGISRKQISDYEVGTAKPRQATYMKILKALDISDQIFSKSDLCSLDINDLDGDQVISFSNNDGDKIMLSKSFCTKNHLNEVDILSVFKIKGDAMQETLFNDDLVLVDTSDKYFISGLIYLIYLISLLGIWGFVYQKKVFYQEFYKFILDIRDFSLVIDCKKSYIHTILTNLYIKS